MSSDEVAIRVGHIDIGDIVNEWVILSYFDRLIWWDLARVAKHVYSEQRLCLIGT